MRTLLEHLPDIIARFDRALRFQYISPAIERVIGLSPDHYIGKTHLEAGLPDMVCERLRVSLFTIFETAQVDVAEFELDLGAVSDTFRRLVSRNADRMARSFPCSLSSVT